MVAKIFVAAGVLLFAAISAPVSAQAQYKFCAKGHGYPPNCEPTRPAPVPTRPAPSSTQQGGYSQQFYPPPFVGLCVTDAFTCEVFRAPGSYCECRNWIGEVFSGIVQ